MVTIDEKMLFIFDYDDTLAPNLHDYSEPILDFVRYCIDKFKYKAPDIPTIINVEDTIDKNNVHNINPETNLPFNFTAKRFPTSLVQAFEYIAEGVKIRNKPFVVTDNHRQDLWKIGESAFEFDRYKRQGLFPGVKDTLNYLIDKGDELKLVSKGEPWVQERKFKATEIAKWFGNDINVVTVKNADILREYCNGYDPKFVWHVGNSIKSDIIPASNAGIGAIYLPLETWSHEKDHNGKPDYSRLIELETISEIIPLYSKLHEM